MRKNLSFVSAIFLAASYLLFALLALVDFPSLYLPMQNWLSDLGSYAMNPRGAIFYNMGIISAGLAMIPFFLGLARWTHPANKVQRLMLRLTQGFGCLAGLAMVMTALFPINLGGVHGFWSAVLYIFLGTAFAFSIAALRYFPHYPRWLLGVGVVVVLANLLWSVALNTYLMEWITVGLFLAYTVLLGIETRHQAAYTL